MRASQIKNHDRITLIYVMGFSYSGSTLLTYMLNAHPMIKSTGEIVGPPHFDRQRRYLCSCGKDIRECPFYLTLQEKIGLDGFQLGKWKWETRAFSQPPRLWERLILGNIPSEKAGNLRAKLINNIPFLSEHIRAVTEINSRFINSACELLDIKYLVDSSKLPVQLEILKRIPGLNIKVIHLVRHPCGCVYSAMKHNGLSRQKAVRYWMRNFKQCEAQLMTFHDRDCLRILYEDLCSTPEEVCRKLCRFLNLEFSLEMLSFGDIEHHIVGNDMRLNKVRQIKESNDWRSNLHQSQIQSIIENTRGFLKKRRLEKYIHRVIDDE